MTRNDQFMAVWRTMAACVAIAMITAAASFDALQLGPAAAGLLYLLPVLWVSARSGMNAGLISAAAAAFCYNYFLLEPRFTLRIHGVGDVAAFLVLTVVAVVTSRLAAGLRAREIEASVRAETSNAEIELTALLARMTARSSLDAVALKMFAKRFGDAQLIRGEDIAAKQTGLAPLDAAAAAWALHHGALSGHASDVMPSADFRFVPLGLRSDDVLALPVQNNDDAQIGMAAAALARVWVQARDRLTVEGERRAREAAEARDAMRRTLITALGHDFRTPLTILKSGLAELDREAAMRLGREVDRLVRLSENLIASAWLESGPAVALEPVDLVDIAAAIVPGTLLSESAIAIETDIPDDLPLVKADSVMLVHLLSNLVDNAVRHATSKVSISARVDSDSVRVSVSDDGGGIDPAIAAHLFEKFYASSDRDRSSGLGLSIACDLATAMGANLSVANISEGGACFTVALACCAYVVEPGN